MAAKKRKKAKRAKTGGRTAERLRIDDDWKSAVKKALKKGKPNAT